TLNLQPSHALNKNQIQTIQHIISNSIASLPPDNITMINQTNRLLTHSNSKNRNLNYTQLKYTSKVETHYQQHIKTILN
ncbi:flagellar M-ring protein FliF, partial [Bacillus subtilis]